MSQENVELARRMIDAWHSGDLSEWAKGLASLWYVVDPPPARPTDVPC